MPVYEYLCERCKVQVEDYQAMSQMKKTIPCPECNRPMKRVMSRLGFVKGNVTPKFYE